MCCAAAVVNQRLVVQRMAFDKSHYPGAILAPIHRDAQYPHVVLSMFAKRHHFVGSLIAHVTA